MKERQEDEEEDFSSYRMTLKKERTLKIEFGSTRPHSVENSFWKRL
jgi:hypothetical protein